MSKKLIELIKESNVIVITGQIGSGRSLLMSKLFHSLNLPGGRLRRFTSLSPSIVSNYFLEEENLFLGEGSKENPKGFLNVIRLARKLKQRGFLNIYRESNLGPGIREVADLYIKTKGINETREGLDLEITHGDQTFKKKIPLVPLDFRNSDNGMKETQRKPSETLNQHAPNP